MYKRQPLLRAGQRFGWHVTFNELAGTWTLNLLAPEGTFVWSEQGVDLASLALQRRPEDVLPPLYNLAYAAARSRAEIRADSVLDVAAGFDANTWYERAVPRLLYEGQIASDRMGGGLSEAAILVVPESTRAEALRRRIAANRSNVTIANTKDATSATLLRLSLIHI